LHHRLQLLAQDPAAAVDLVDRKQLGIPDRDLADRHGPAEGVQDPDLDGVTAGTARSPVRRAAAATRHKREQPGGERDQASVRKAQLSVFHTFPLSGRGWASQRAIARLMEPLIKKLSVTEDGIHRVPDLMDGWTPSYQPTTDNAAGVRHDGVAAVV